LQGTSGATGNQGKFLSQEEIYNIDQCLIINKMNILSEQNYE